ncbi:hypothetical protein DUI87_24063 [Hirundo rustica rustica]|uniref:Protein Wnt n=1 Tax=Hirundo rustica rustica TaxID=333673 RepID=A0A3M0JKW4_HIRRU|nr:hypothetical protein DUI87_24063 [Hirundo rustica rustica]
MGKGLWWIMGFTIPVINQIHHKSADNERSPKRLLTSMVWMEQPGKGELPGKTGLQKPSVSSFSEKKEGWKAGNPGQLSLSHSRRYIGALGARVICDNIPGLVNKQRQLCQRYPDIMQSVGEGAKEWIRECQHQFRHHRWNCSTLDRDHTVFGRVMLRSSREAAFVYAISSAGVVYAITRACSQGDLKVCSCDPLKRGRSKDERGEFDWGGCSDNINYGIRFAKAFVDAKEKKVKDARALMNLHNNRCGRMDLLAGNVRFSKKGDYLRKKYNGAIQVTMNQDGTGFTVANKNFRKPTKTDLVYFENSPDYCVMDKSAGSLGTAGRVCNKVSRGTDGCEVMCCGQGYDTTRVTRVTKCECKFHWCCAVRCKECEDTVDVHTCKAPKRAEWLDQT